MNPRYWTIAFLCVFALLVTAAASSAAPSEKQSLVIFPFATSSVATANQEYVGQHAEDLVLLLKEGLSATGRYSVVLFDPRVPGVRRAVEEQKFTERQLADPIDTTFEGVEMARQLAMLMGADIALIGSIDGYDFRRERGELEITVTAELVDVKTGGTSSAITTGLGKTEVADAERSESGLGIAATYQIAEKLLAQLADVSDTELIDQPPVEKPSRTKMDKRLIPAIVGAILLGFFISSN